MLRMSKLTSSICEVENLFVTKEYVVLTMEYLEGLDLSEYLRQMGPVKVDQLLIWIQPVLSAIQHAHSVGIIHRDIKPSNLFLTKSGQIKILDFGIAKIFDSKQNMTKTRFVLGTPTYMSPEQITTPRKVDARSDIYSLGITIWALAKGESPYQAGEEACNNYIVQTKIINQPLPLIMGRASVLNEIIAKATNKDIESRYPDCEQLGIALSNIAKKSIQLTWISSKSAVNG